MLEHVSFFYQRIEGIPFIIRFKTLAIIKIVYIFVNVLCIEGIPFIIRFKTHY